MNKKNFLLVVALIFGLFNTSAQASAYITYIDPFYAGLEYKLTQVDAHGDWNRIFTTPHPGPAFFWGGRFPNACTFPFTFGLEFGYSWTVNKAKATVIPVGSTFLGVVNNSGVAIRASGKAFFKSGYMDLKTYIPILFAPYYQCYYPELILALGVASSRVVMEVKATPLGTVTGSNTLIAQLDNIKGSTRSTIRAGVGLQGMFWDYWGLRGMVRWEDFSRLRANRSQGLESVPGIRKIFSDGLSFSLGIYCTFQAF